jgi:hypothetical protein
MKTPVAVNDIWKTLPKYWKGTVKTDSLRCNLLNNAIQRVYSDLQACFKERVKIPLRQAIIQTTGNHSQYIFIENAKYKNVKYPVETNGNFLEIPIEYNSTQDLLYVENELTIESINGCKVNINIIDTDKNTDYFCDENYTPYKKIWEYFPDLSNTFSIIFDKEFIGKSLYALPAQYDYYEIMGIIRLRHRTAAIPLYKSILGFSLNVFDLLCSMDRYFIKRSE